MALEIDSVEPVADDSGQAAQSEPATPDAGQSNTEGEGTTADSGSSATVQAQPKPDSAPNMYDPDTWTGKQVHEYWQPLYTRRSQELSETKKIAEQWNQIQQNPWPVINDFVQRAGYKIVSGAEAGEQPDNGDGYGNQGANIEQRVAQMLDQRLAPIQQSLLQRETNHVVSELNRKFPDWQQYEDTIQQNLAKYKDLAYDIDKLYDMSVPGHVRDARAYQRYLKSLDNKQTLGKTEPAESSVKPEPTEPSTAGDFDASWQYAMQKHGLKSTL